VTETAPSSASEATAKTDEPAPSAATAEAKSTAEAGEAKTDKASDTSEAKPTEANQVAKYDDSQASAFVAEAQAPQKKRGERKVSSKAAAASKSARTEKSDSPAKEKEASKVSSTAKRATAPAAPAAKAKPAAATEIKEAKTEEKAESSPVSAAVNEAAATALGNAAKLASSCRPQGGPSGPGKARVIYSNDGEVSSVEILTAKFRDTLTGSCVRMVFRRAKIEAFKGEPPTFIKSFTIPEQ
jgi:hypothetical protein